MSFGTSVLVVDDEPLIRIAFTDMLENVGFLLANTAAAAISILSENEKICLIEPDMDMRERMDGTRACYSFLVVWSRDPDEAGSSNARAWHS